MIISRIVKACKVVIDAAARAIKQAAKAAAKQAARKEPKLAADKKSKQTKTHKDPRITAPRFSWREFLVMWFALMVIGTGTILILSTYYPDISLDFASTLSTLGYLGLMALIFVLLTVNWRRLVYERPIKALGAAARQVTQGDFSVRLLLPNTDVNNKSYLDVMFEDFNTMVEALGGIETLQDDFVGNVSHEIKTPLATIENYASALKKNTLSEQERLEYIEAIASASKRLSALVSNILRLNKLENQTIVAQPEAYDLSEQLRNCILGFELAWEDKGIEIEVDVDDSCLIIADETLLGLVWNNLLSNAIKFTEPGGTIRVSQRTEDAQVYIDISDTGLGIDEATKGRIFDKFYQGDTSHAQEGNGLGLALCARALKLAGGEIMIASVPGEGSTFTVLLKDASA